jgi:carbonic anhydrase
VDRTCTVQDRGEAKVRHIGADSMTSVPGVAWNLAENITMTTSPRSLRTGKVCALLTRALVATVLFASAATAPAQTHTVVPGNTLISIARQYGVSVDALRHANGLTANRIRKGQRLTIPAAGAAAVAEHEPGEDHGQQEEDAAKSSMIAAAPAGAGSAGGAGTKKQRSEDSPEEQAQAAAETVAESSENAPAPSAGAVDSHAEVELQAEANEPKTEELQAAAETSGATIEASSASAGDCNAGTAAAEPTEPEPQWSYEGDSGPEHWAELTPRFETCGKGARQTPIDVASGEAVAVGLEDIQFQYGTAEGTVVNNGHTIQVNVGDGNSVTVDGVTYALAQFHFHTPSEHTLDGNSFPMELHLVHKDEQGNLVVVGVMLEKGEKNPALSQVWTRLPKTHGKEVALKEPLDLNTLLPTDRSAYRYVGSLTTPPCTEGVKWVVMKSSVTMTMKQIAAFKKIFSVNARPLQPINSRSVLIDVTESVHASN